MRPASDIAFSPAVKAIQTERGSRNSYARIEQRGGFRTGITPDLVEFLGNIDTAYLATTNSMGQPYAQHRGGPKGFIRQIDAQTLGFVDYAGNRQYVTTGNLAENDKAFLFLMDYAHRRRIKLWGTARVVTGDVTLIDRLMPDSYPARPEQVILFSVTAWDVNCPQHIPQKLDASDTAHVVAELRAQITRLQTDNRLLLQQIERHQS